MRTPTVPPGHVDPPLVGAPRPGPVAAWPRRRGRRTRAAGEGLAAAALVHAHADAPDAVGDERIGGHDELDVRAVGRIRLDDRDVREVDGRRVRRRSARATTTCGLPTLMPRPGPGRVQIARPHRAARRRRGATGPGRPGTRARCAARRARRPACRSASVSPGSSSTSPLLDEVPGEDPDAVAAHLGDAAVGVVVVHEPLGARVFGESGGTLGDGSATAHRADHPVGADTEMPIGQIAATARASRSILAVGVGEQHEVVARALALGEVEVVVITRASLSAAADDGLPGRRASTSATSRYRRNQPTCRRA